MGTSEMILVILVLLGICFALWRLLKDDDDPLNKIPGPVGKPFVGISFDFIYITPRDLFVKLRGYAKEYGDRYLVKAIGRRIFLHIQNPNDIEIVLSHTKNIKKSNPYMFLKSWLGMGLLLSDGPKWHRRRRILTPTFHFNILKSFLIVMEEQSLKLVEKLKKTEETAVNLLPVISDIMLLIICETAMGTQLDSNKSAETIEYKETIMQLGPLLLDRLNKIWLHNEYLFKMFPLSRKFEKCLYTVQSFVDKVILERKKARQIEDGNFGNDGGKTKKRLAMLDLLLEAEKKGEIDLEGVREEVNTFMFAGHDTTSRAITFSLMLLADHQEVQERIYEEVQSILGNSERALTMSDLTEMIYLQAVIKESLRLYPSVPVIARKVSEDFMLDDVLIKKDVEIVVHIYDLHRRPDLFPNPEEFKPERFLTGEVIHPYAFVPFSAGPRNCIGQRFAMIEMKCVLSYICRNFRLHPQRKGEGPELMTDLLITPVEPIFVKFIRR